MKYEDLTGQTFGELTALEYAGRINKNTYWTCRCSCGRILNVQAGRLKSCKHPTCNAGEHKRKDIVGMRYGRLVVLEYVETDKHGDSKWKCMCDCGSVVTVSKSNLSKNPNSCKMCKGTIRYKEGQTIGEHGIVYIHDVEPYYNPISQKKERRALFKCTCGKTFESIIYCVKNGDTSSCGCARKNFRVTYNNGDALGDYGLTFISEDGFSYSSDGTKRRMCIAKCVCGAEFRCVIDDAKNNHVTSCGCRVQSKGAEDVERCLIAHSVDYKKEYTFDDLIDKQKLRFDFAVFEDNRLRYVIEYQGEQHYRDVPVWGDLSIRQRHDNMKREYCLKNNITLIEIPYWVNVQDTMNELLSA